MSDLQQQFNQLNKSIAADRLNQAIGKSKARPELRKALADLLLGRCEGKVLTASEWGGVVDSFLASDDGAVFKSDNFSEPQNMTIDEMFCVAIDGR